MFAPSVYQEVTSDMALFVSDIFSMTKEFAENNINRSENH